MLRLAIYAGPNVRAHVAKKPDTPPCPDSTANGENSGICAKLSESDLAAHGA